MTDVTVSLGGIVKHFESLPDPRHARNRRHLLIDVIVIAVCGVIVGCKGPTSIDRWATAKQEWLGEFLEVPNGIPSRDCIRRILSLLKPEAFQKCFREWIVACLLGDANGSHRTIAIDGMSAAVQAAFAEGRLFSDLGLDWAVRGDEIDLVDYRYFPSFRTLEM